MLARSTSSGASSRSTGGMLRSDASSGWRGSGSPEPSSSSRSAAAAVGVLLLPSPLAPAGGGGSTSGTGSGNSGSPGRRRPLRSAASPPSAPAAAASAWRRAALERRQMPLLLQGPRRPPGKPRRRRRTPRPTVRSGFQPSVPTERATRPAAADQDRAQHTHQVHQRRAQVRAEPAGDAQGRRRPPTCSAGQAGAAPRSAAPDAATARCSSTLRSAGRPAPAGAAPGRRTRRGRRAGAL